MHASEAAMSKRVLSYLVGRPRHRGDEDTGTLGGNDRYEQHASQSPERSIVSFDPWKESLAGVLGPNPASSLSRSHTMSDCTLDDFLHRYQDGQRASSIGTSYACCIQRLSEPERLVLHLKSTKLRRSAGSSNTQQLGEGAEDELLYRPIAKRKIGSTQAIVQKGSAPNASPMAPVAPMSPMRNDLDDFGGMEPINVEDIALLGPNAPICPTRREHPEKRKIHYSYSTPAATKRCPYCKQSRTGLWYISTTLGAPLTARCIVCRAPHAKSGLITMSDPSERSRVFRISACGTWSKYEASVKAVGSGYRAEELEAGK